MPILAFVAAPEKARQGAFVFGIGDRGVLVTAVIADRQHRLRSWAACLALMLLLAACARQGGGYYGSGGAVPYDGYDPATEHGRRFAPHRYYPPPGPPEDPWAPYIHEAAARFGLPERWVRAVMRQESGGREQAVSPVGAMGLMQVMPATYEGLRSRHGLGDDPYDPHNNILAGTAYMREMYDRYGAPGFLVAYNAGPNRLDSYLAGSGGLPDETVNYVAAIAPHLGDGVPFSGPLAIYASAQPASLAASIPTVISLASGCDVNAAYDPDRPCKPLERAATVPARPSLTLASTGGCDADSAYDPRFPCRAASSFRPSPAVSGLYRAPAGSNGAWAIQVGAFANQGLARAVAEGARAEAPDQLRAATVTLPTTTPFGNAVLYRARLTHLSAGEAAGACSRLNQRQLPCVVVQPSGS